MKISKISSREPESFNILNTQVASGFGNLANLIDSLLEVNIYGEIVEVLAEKWGIEEIGLTC